MVAGYGASGGVSHQGAADGRMTVPVRLADGEPLAALRSPPEAVADLDPPCALSEAAERLLDGFSARRDVAVPGEALRFREGHLRLGGELFALRPVAGRQLRALAARALGRTVTSGGDIRHALTRRGTRPMLVRIEGDAVRAVLGAGFVPFDDLTTVQHIADAVERTARDLRVRFIAKSETLTILRVTVRSSRVAVRPDDEFELGIEIANSEVGLGAFTIRPLLWRARCWNYALGPRPSLRLVHAGCPRQLERDWHRELARAVETAGTLLDRWRRSPEFDEANAITDAAKTFCLRRRCLAERLAQEVIDRMQD